MDIEQELQELLDDITEKANNLLGDIDKQFSRRKKEITDIFSYTYSQPEHIRNIQNKMVHCLLYSHWEGLIKDVMLLFFKFLRKSRLRFNQLKPNFHICAALNQFHSFNGSYALNVSYIRKYFDNSLNLDKLFNCNLDTFCNTKSNLNSEVLEEICYKLGISTKNFETKFNFINQTLLSTRNAIAHGEERVIDSDDLGETKNMCLQLMESFCDELKEMIINLTFLDVANRSLDPPTDRVRG